jgi:hypothetical protein
MKRITILAAVSLGDLCDNGAAVEDRDFDTLGDAKRRARYLLTEEYRRITESAECLGYAQVLVDGECVADYFAVETRRSVR